MISYREAQLSNLSQIRAINAHYILHTSLTFMRTPPPLETYIDKWRDLQARGLPYLVAIDDKEKKEGSDVVLGYASLSPFRGHLLSYAPTVELSLFVHPDYQSRSIGTGLLNRLLDLVRDGKVKHIVEEGNRHDLTGAEQSAGGDDSQVRNIIAVMAVDPEGQDGGEALRRWYIRRGFVEKGRLEKVGFKRDRW